ncbi:MAG: hypothetical protein IPP07_14850 [Holophagales bacterium]|nr:hypothetical protein [Holophagales bacterium]
MATPPRDSISPALSVVFLMRRPSWAEKAKASSVRDTVVVTTVGGPPSMLVS